MTFKKTDMQKILEYAKQLKISYRPVGKYRHQLFVGEDVINFSNSEVWSRKGQPNAHHGLKSLIAELQEMYLDNKHIVR